MLHGFLSAADLLLLMYAYFTVGLPSLAQVALTLFLLAAAIGTYINIHYHWAMPPLPKVAGTGSCRNRGQRIYAVATFHLESPSYLFTITL